PMGTRLLVSQQHAKLGVDEGADAQRCVFAGLAAPASYGVGGPAHVVCLPGDFQVEAREQPRRDEQVRERDTARVPVGDAELTLTVFVDEVGAIQPAWRGLQAA